MMNHLFTVVVNADEQYSIWPSSKSLPLGWFEIEPGMAVSKEACLELIALRWQDMRPLVLRKMIQNTAVETVQS